MSRRTLVILSALTLGLAAGAQTAGKGSTTPPPNPSVGPESTSDVGKYANWDRDKPRYTVRTDVKGLFRITSVDAREKWRWEALRSALSPASTSAARCMPGVRILLSPKPGSLMTR